MPNHNNNLERLLDLVAEALIESPLVPTPATVENNQTFIRNGVLQRGAGEGVLALFQKEEKANTEDLNQTTPFYDLAETLNDYANLIDYETYSVNVKINPPSENNNNTYRVIVETNQDLPYYDITNLVQSSDGFNTNPLNISQFIPLTKEGLKKSVIDVEKAEEYLDTNIFELLPTGDTRQARIIRFFQELNALLPPLPGAQGQPPFDFPDDDDDRVNRDNNYNWVSASLYDKNTSISYAQDNTDGNIDEEDAFIHRLKLTANDTNSSRTIEDIYNTIKPYLEDILEEPISLQDDRPEYQNQSSGYLQFRNPNQGIIIRNTNREFIEGLDPNNLTYLNRTDLNGNDLPGTGFTITMWVRFLDKVSEGTLFNFSNPTRDENPFGFKLETFVLNKDERTYYTTGNPSTEAGAAEEGDSLYTWGSTVENSSDLSNQGIFSNSNTARFVRLMVRDGDDGMRGDVRDSHVGNDIMRKLSWNYPELTYRDGILNSTNLRLINQTFIPENFNEWYFICASYNPNVIEPNETNIEPDVYGYYNTNTDFWMNHVTPTLESPDVMVANSNYGNKCKVEIISRTDLLRARGFKV